MNISSLRKHPIYRISIWIALAAVLYIIWQIYTHLKPNLLTFGDSVQYWAAGRLVLIGENPYSAEMVLELRHQAGNFLEFPPDAISRMIYPPWILQLLIPFGIPTYPLSRSLWFLFNLTLVFISAKLIWDLYQGRKNQQWIAYLTVFSFAPTLFLLLVGHITSLQLLGAVVFLNFVRYPKGEKWRDILAGSFAALVVIKFQLLYLFLLALILWTIEFRRWNVLIGFALFLLLTSVISLSINQQVFAQFWEAFSNYPFENWETPTLGRLLRVVFAVKSEWLQFLPSIFGVIWFIYYWQINHKNWDWLTEMPILIFVSLITSTHMWTYDMVLLLLPVLQVMIELIRRGWSRSVGIIILFYIIINGAAIYLHTSFHDFYFFWFTPAILIWYLIGRKLAQAKISTISS